MLEALPALLDRGAEVVVLGSGEHWYEDALRSLAARRGDGFRAFIGFDSSLSHLVEGGADFFLMPSLYEPCGLNQMYSLRYGTVPVVRATGGLEDTVRDADLPDGTGFKFRDFDVAGLLWASGRAIDWWWHRRDALDALRRRGMRPGLVVGELRRGLRAPVRLARRLIRGAAMSTRGCVLGHAPRSTFRRPGVLRRDG